MVETNGSAAPAGKKRRSPAAEGWITVAFNDTAFAEAGIPQTPVRGNVRVEPA
jgi:hypothetical protein